MSVDGRGGELVGRGSCAVILCCSCVLCVTVAYVLENDGIMGYCSF